MHTPFGHLTYCSNIHAGESWKEHFEALQKYIPAVKQTVCPHKQFGIGLRLSNTASTELEIEENLEVFQQWLNEQQCYVFTMNGFPYGGFHRTVVKEKVHEPDWTSGERVDYTIRLAKILAVLLPQEMNGGISTSPLTYRHWYKNYSEKHAVYKQTTTNILLVVKALIQLKEATGKTIHLDVEPEPDGLLESGTEFLQWYNEYLLPMAAAFLDNEFRYCKEDAVAAVKEHVQLCYDICHFAVGYENHAGVIQQLKMQEIKIGKVQISAALMGLFADTEREKVIQAFQQFNESTYLHQVVAKDADGNLKRYQDLPQALEQANDPSVKEWRAHFHVPLFIETYGALLSTQKDIQELLRLHRKQPVTTHLEVETYTWEVLPQELKLPIEESIARELEWVLKELEVDKEVRT